MLAVWVSAKRSELRVPLVFLFCFVFKHQGVLELLDNANRNSMLISKLNGSSHSVRVCMELPTIKNVFSYVPTSKRLYADVTCSELIGTKSMELQSMVNYLKKRI